MKKIGIFFILAINSSILTMDRSMPFEDAVYQVVQNRIAIGRSLDEPIDELRHRVNITYVAPVLRCSLGSFSGRNSFLKALKLALENKADPNLQSDSTEGTALHIFLQSPHQETETASLLFEYKIDPNIQNKNGLTPLHLLCSVQADSYDPMAMASRISIANMLIQNGADPNLQSKEKKTPLFGLMHHGYSYASSKTDAENLFFRQRKHLINILISAGLNIYATDDTGKTAMQRAYESGWLQGRKLANFAEHAAFHKPAYVYLLTRPDSPFNSLPRDCLKLIIDTMFPDLPWPKENYKQLLAQSLQTK